MSSETDFQVGVKASPEEIYKTLTVPKKLAQWWTSDTRGSGTKVGDTLEFSFGDSCEKFDVTALKPGKHHSNSGADRANQTDLGSNEEICQRTL